jgi:hypothetical protein
VDTIRILQEIPLGRALDEAKEAAIRIAVQNGAKPETVSIMEVDYIPLAYATNKATRIMVKAAGELDLSNVPVASNFTFEDIEGIEGGESERIVVEGVQELAFDPLGYRPKIDPKTREWILSEIDIKWIAEGCGKSGIRCIIYYPTHTRTKGILGTGGGGSTYYPYVACRNAIRAGKVLKVKDTVDIKDEQWVLSVGYMGSPSVAIEKLPAGTEATAALECIWQYTGTRKDTVGVMPCVSILI